MNGTTSPAFVLQWSPVAETGYTDHFTPDPEPDPLPQWSPIARTAPVELSRVIAPMARPN